MLKKCKIIIKHTNSHIMLINCSREFILKKTLLNLFSKFIKVFRPFKEVIIYTPCLNDIINMFIYS